MTILRTHLMQLWFTLSDPAMEEAFFDTPIYREFVQLEELAWMPDESNIRWFRHNLEEQKSCRLNTRHRQRPSDCQESVTLGRYYDGCDPDCSANHYHEQRKVTRSRHVFEQEGQPVVL